MPPKHKATSAADPFSTTEKLMQTFRMPRELVSFLKGEADRNGRDLTAFVNRQLDGFRVLKGVEADIMPDGSLDYGPEILSTSIKTCPSSVEQVETWLNRTFKVSSIGSISKRRCSCSNSTAKRCSRIGIPDIDRFPAIRACGATFPWS